MQRRSPPPPRCAALLLAAAALLVEACASPEPSDPSDDASSADIFAAAPDADRIAEVPGHPGLRAPVDLMVVLLADGEPASAAERLADAVDAEVVGRIQDLGHYQLRLPTTTMAELDAAIEVVSADSAVEAAGHDFLVQFRDCPAPSDVLDLDDTAACPWTDIGYPALLDIFEERGDELPGGAITVAVIDSGVNVSNPEFGDVRIRNVHAADGSTEGMTDPSGHGTQVAGVIAADDGDGGVSGIASRLLGPRLTVVWGLHPGAGSSALAVASQSLVATRLAIDAGARVVNQSFGFGRFAQPSPTSVQVAVRGSYQRVMRDHPDVLFVAAAANQDWELTAQNDAPAGILLPNVLTVGSSMPCDPLTRVGPSARGPLIDLVAQGERISLVDPQRGSPPVLADGTSFAAPQVTAAAAVLRSLEPTLTAAGVRDLLLGHAALGPESTSGRHLDLARPVLQLLLDQGHVLASDIDADEDGLADEPGLVAARVCGGSSLTVEGFPSEQFSGTSRPEDGVFNMGFLGADGFGIALQKPGPTSLSLACDACAWDLAAFPLTDDPSEGVSGVFTFGFDVGGDTVSGSWTFDRCVVESRYERVLSEHEGPQTVLVQSRASGVFEVSSDSLDDAPRSFEAVLDAPFTVEPLAADHPTIVAVESLCEHGRAP